MSGKIPDKQKTAKLTLFTQKVGEVSEQFINGISDTSLVARLYGCFEGWNRTTNS